MSAIRITHRLTSICLTLMAPQLRTIGRTRTTQAFTATHTPIGAVKTYRILRTFQLQVTNQMSTALIRTHEFLAIFLSHQARKSMFIRKKQLSIQARICERRNHHRASSPRYLKARSQLTQKLIRGGPSRNNTCRKTLLRIRGICRITLSNNHPV